jgi:hypothetical protein
MQIPDATEWAEESGYRVVAKYLPGAVDLSFEETNNGRDFIVRAGVTIARWRWDRLVQAMAPLPEEKPFH